MMKVKRFPEVLVVQLRLFDENLRKLSMKPKVPDVLWITGPNVCTEFGIILAMPTFKF